MKTEDCLTQLLGHLLVILVLQQKLLRPILLFSDSAVVKLSNALNSIDIFVQ